jgi:anti-anti-sigma regulatory factor
VQYDFQLEGQALIATLRGELDLHTSPEFKDTLTKLFETHSTLKHLIMNVKGFDICRQFRPGSHPRYVIGRLQERGGRLFFVQANPQIKRILQMSGFQKISEFANSTSDVLERI